MVVERNASRYFREFFLQMRQPSVMIAQLMPQRTSAVSIKDGAGHSLPAVAAAGPGGISGQLSANTTGPLMERLHD